MSSDDRSPDSPASWILYAQVIWSWREPKSRHQSLFETLVFHAQQAAEKALKAVLIAKAVSFPRTHSIRILLNLMPSETTIPAEVLDAVVLTEYANIKPLPWRMGTSEKRLTEAVRLAQAVVRWAAKMRSKSLLLKMRTRSEVQRHIDFDTNQEMSGSSSGPAFPSRSINPRKDIGSFTMSFLSTCSLDHRLSTAAR